MNTLVVAVLGLVLGLQAASPPGMNEWIDYEVERMLTEPEKKDMSFATLMNWQLGSIKAFREAAGTIVSIILQGDSQDGISGARSGGALDDFLDDIGVDLLAYLYPYQAAGGITLDFDPLSTSGGWDQISTKTYGNAWGDGNTTHHISYGGGAVLTGAPSGPDLFCEYAIPYDMLPQMAEGQEMTFRIFYRKVNANDLTLNLRPIGIDDATVNRGSDNTYVTLESGNGSTIGTVDYTHPDTVFWTRPSTNDAIGFRIFVSTAGGDFVHAPVTGNRIEILGVLVFPSETSNSAKVLDSSFTDGVIYAPLQSSGYDASETMRDQARLVRVAVTTEIANMRGDGSTPNADPIDTVMHKFGHNNDTIAASYTAGLETLRAEWDTVIAGATASGSVRHLFYAPWGFEGAGNNDRMEAQATELAEYCFNNTHGFINEWLYYGGVDNLESLTGLNPFDVAFGTYTMDASAIHPDDTATPILIWKDRYAHSAPANIVSSFSIGGNRSRDRNGRNR